MDEKNRQILISVSHSDPLDWELKKKFKNDLLQYDIANKKIFEKSNYYLNIFGDWLVEVIIDKNISKQIDDFFTETQNFNDKTKRASFKYCLSKRKK